MAEGLLNFLFADGTHTRVRARVVYAWNGRFIPKTTDPSEAITSLLSFVFRVLYCNLYIKRGYKARADTIYPFTRIPAVPKYILYI